MEIKDVNRPISSKQIDSFYVEFFQIEGNKSNILGRQVKSVERPVLSFNTTPIHNRGVQHNQTGTITFQPISVVFHDDDESFVAKLLYDQAYRQAGKLDPPTPLTHCHFEIRVKVYNSAMKLVEDYTLKRCLVESITHLENITQDSENNQITATIVFDTVDYNFT